LKTGTSILALTLNAVPAMACTPVSSDTTISSSTGCVNWSGGNLSITNTGAISTSSYLALTVSTSSVGALTNSGRISAGSSAVFNTGSIGALTNSGSINAHSVGIFNGGTIGTLTNSGTISGVNFGIFSTGTIGTLSNSGSISDGGIVTSGSIGALNNSGTIIGGGWTGIANGGTIGTLTNTGTISGGGGNAGILNGGNIGTLTNGGSISGSGGIINNAGSAIVTLSNSGTISGGAGNAGLINGGSIGTLTNSGVLRGSIGIASSGSIGTLTNKGAISGGFTGIANNSGGSIGALTNSGVISGSKGIFNAGAVGALSNSGTIEGPTAIFNASTGTLGPIVNSGLIAGNIVNLSSQTLTMSGSSGPMFGILTGASGAIGSADQGTITSTASNLTFAAGNLLLNDVINVGSNMVVNSGATLKVVNPVSITGSYQQAGGGLVAQATSASSYGYLNVSGNATVANAAIVITGSGLLSGTSYTIVRSGGTGSYTGDTASIIGTNGLAATLETAGNDLVVRLAASAFGSSSFTAIGLAAGGVAAQLGPVLDRINGSDAARAVAFQNAVLVPLVLLPQSQRGQAMKQLAPAYSTSQMVLNSAPTAQETVEQHQQTTMRYDPKTGEAAGFDTGDSALWAHLLDRGARRDSKAGFDGYHSSDAGLVAGVDHLFTPEMLGGVAAIGLRGSLSGIDSPSAQSATLDSFQLIFYGTYRHGRAFIDGQLGAGWNQFSQTRSIAFLGETASASFDGQQYLAHALAGYDFPVGGTGGMVITPLVALRWLRARNGAYSETGAGAANLSVKGQALSGLTQELGVKTTWSFATEFGQLVPEVTAEWLHDYTDGPIATSGMIGGETFAVTVPRIAADGARIGATATLKSSDRLSFGVEYDGELRAGYRSHTGQINARWQF
jgi:uncharacterized protein with beta-barrel porin domain